MKKLSGRVLACLVLAVAGNNLDARAPAADSDRVQFVALPDGRMVYAPLGMSQADVYRAEGFDPDNDGVIAAPPAATPGASVTYFIPGKGFGSFPPGTTLEGAFGIVCGDPERSVKYPNVPCEKLVNVAAPAASANATVTYFIPGMGFAKFDAGTTLEQAFENVCLDPETPIKFPEVPCDKLMAAAQRARLAATDADEPSNHEIGRSGHTAGRSGTASQALWSALIAQFSGAAIAVLAFRIIAGQKSAVSAKRFAGWGTALGLWMFFSQIFNSLLNGGTFEYGFNKGFGFLVWSVILGVAGYLIGRHRDKKGGTKIAGD